MTSNAGLTFNVSTLLSEALGSTRSHGIADAAFRFDEGRTRADGDLRMTRMDGSVLVEARIRVAVEEVCARCLQTFRQPLQVELREEFWPDYDPVLQRHVEVPAGREGFPIESGLLDLQEPLRQHVEMARPMQPICRPDCPGADADADHAAAAESPIDHRWEALAELRRDLQ
jgi:uncharacterized protein